MTPAPSRPALPRSAAAPAGGRPGIDHRRAGKGGGGNSWPSQQGKGYGGYGGYGGNGGYGGGKGYGGGYGGGGYGSGKGGAYGEGAYGGPPPSSGVREGDWRCGNCGANVFASTNACFKCQTPKGGGAPPTGWRPPFNAAVGPRREALAQDAVLLEIRQALGEERGAAT